MNIKILGILIIAITLISTRSSAQDEKISPRVDLSFHQPDQDVPFVLINLRQRIERRFFPMPGVPISVHMMSGSNEFDFGMVTSNDNGLAKAIFSDELIKEWDSLAEVEFTASIGESDSTEAVEESLAISHARINISGDDERLISAIVERKTATGWEVVPEVELKFFIKRYFGRLPVGEDFYTTDDSGMAEFEFESTIPGDAEGNIQLGAIIEDSEEFGTISAITLQKWGVPLIDDNTEFESRTLWATRDKTPYWLLIFPNLIILGVWSIIGYLVFQIFKIKKLQNQA